MKLVTRENDNKIMIANVVKFIEWDKEGRGKALHDDIAVGRSMILEPNSLFYAWLTTVITEIIENSDKEIKFKTKNSTYTIHEHDNIQIDQGH